MTRKRSATRALLALALASAAVTVLLGLQYARELPVLASEAAGNVALLRAHEGGSASAMQQQPSVGCQEYIPFIVQLNAEWIGPEQLLSGAEGWSSCWPENRKRLLKVHLVGAMAFLGRWDDVCRELNSVQAADRLLALAEEAADEGNWEDASHGLTCLVESNWGESWISPWRVAVLYQHLGQYLESQQAYPQAIAAYQQAADWHPGVWATPYLQGASLLWRQDRAPDALNFLIAALNKSPDDTAAFELWYQLAEYWAAQGDNNDSLCAYRQAAQLLDRLPTPPMVDLAKLQRSAEAASTLPAKRCFQSVPITYPR